MADLNNQLDQDIKKAMISKDQIRLDVLRFLKSAVKYAMIEKKDAWSDADTRSVIQKQIKQRRESIDQFSKAGRVDLAQPEEVAVKILEAYLPQQIGDEELASIVRAEAIAAAATTKKDFGRMMKILTEKLEGRSEARRISEALGKVLT